MDIYGEMGVDLWNVYGRDDGCFTERYMHLERDPHGTVDQSPMDLPWIPHGTVPYLFQVPHVCSTIPSYLSPRKSRQIQRRSVGTSQSIVTRVPNGKGIFLGT